MQAAPVLLKNFIYFSLIDSFKFFRIKIIIIIIIKAKGLTEHVCRYNKFIIIILIIEKTGMAMKTKEKTK